MTTATDTAETTANEQANNRPKTDDNAGHVVTTDITSQMESAYLDYAMSVIVSRALPDVRDGLKPVHRRILYAMYSDLNLTSDKPHKKSARIVGEVLGKYHPHGDQAVYDSMVRMAQEFSLRYPLIDGQGNFGSIDGDGAAAMRYTEARLDSISDLMLHDLDKDTVDWHENFDNSLEEPDILPAALPNLLINGSNGIAVGMATNIPPHNLGEVIDALVYMIDNFNKADEITVEELMQFIKGPDFPTGGILYRYREGKKDEEATDAIAQGYAVGRSRLILQAKAHFEEMSRNRSRIVVTELPYQTNKTALIERIAMLVRDGKIEGITDLRDESDRTGMRMVIEMTRNVDAKRILERLFKLTPLQQTFGLQMLALVDGEPITLGLRRMLQLFIQHRQEIIRRRTEFDLARAKARAHIVEGLLRALDILDEVIATIRASQRVDTARDNLVKNFKFTKIQAQAILDMQLRRLAALERRKLQDEYKELTKLIKYLEGLLASPKKMLEVIKHELLEIQEEYGDVRKTQLVERTKGTLTSTDLLPDQDVWVTVSAAGELRRQASIANPGASEAKQVGKDAGIAVVSGNTKDPLYLFGKDGQCRQVSIHEVPQSGGSKHASMWTDFTRRDTITAALTLPRNPGPDGYLFMVTELGMVKRVTIADFAKAAPLDPVVMGVDPKDKLGWVLSTDGDQEVILVASSGHSIRFSESDVRSMGLAAAGVGGMKVKKGHRIIYAGIVDPNGELLTMTRQGYTKRTAMSDYSKQGRNGGGITTHKTTTRTGELSAALVVNEAAMTEPSSTHLVAITDKGMPKVEFLANIPQMGRSVQGRQVIAVDMGSTIVSVHTVEAPSQPSPNGNGGPNNGNGSNGNGRASSNGGTVAQSKTTAGTSSTGASARRKSTTTTARKSSTSGRRSSAGRAAATTGTTARKRTTKATATKTETAKGRSSKAVSVKGTTAKATTAKGTSAKSGTAKAGAAKAGAAKSTSARTKAKSTTASKSTTTKSTKAAAVKTPSAKASTRTTAAGQAQKKSTTTAKAASTRATATKRTSAKSASVNRTSTKASARTARSDKASSKSATAKKPTATQAKSAAGTKTTTRKKAAPAKTNAAKTTAAKATSSKATSAKATAKSSSARTARKTAQATVSKAKTTKAGTTRTRAASRGTAKSATTKDAATKRGTSKPASQKTTQKAVATKKPAVKKPTEKKSVAKAAASKASTAATSKPKPTPRKAATKPQSTTKKAAAKKAPAKRSAKLATVTSVTRSQVSKKKKTAKK